MSHSSLVYDGSFDGFLTAIFQVFERKLKDVSIIPEERSNFELFSEKIAISTDTTHAERVWKGLKKKLSSKALHQLYLTFLTEDIDREKLMLGFIRHVFESNYSVSSDYGNKYVLGISKAAKMIGREAHRMEAFVRFKLTKDGLYFANIEPDFDVLPVISKHFKNRYADQRWMIYDLKRKYGIYYNLDTVETVEMSFSTSYNTHQNSLQFLDESELQFQQLWNDYFKHTNIASRKNMKLHLQHVPRRYWKYLSEKQPYI